MSNKYKFFDNNLKYFVTLTIVYWIDVFSNMKYRNIIIESLIFAKKNKGLKIHGWVIMSNHVHLIISCEEGSNISDILRDIKKFTSSEIIKQIIANPHESRKKWILFLFSEAGKQNSNNTIYQFWQQDNHPINIERSYDVFKQKLNYIHKNPVKAGIVENEADYIYSSAGDYYGKKGLIEIDFE